jgi:hypothetical protein
MGVVFLHLWRRSMDATPSPSTVEAHVRAGGGADDVGVRHLGEGVFELVGRVADQETARRLEDIAEETVGVVGVVNRLWIA